MTNLRKFFVPAIAIVFIIAYLVFSRAPSTSSNTLILTEQETLVSPDTNSMDACLAIWNDPLYLDALRDDGIDPPTDAEQICKEILADKPQPSYMSSNLFFVPDYETYINFSDLSDEQLTEMGFFSTRDEELPKQTDIDGTFPHGRGNTTQEIDDGLKRGPACNCRWVTTSLSSPNPTKTTSYTQPAKGSGTHFGKSFSLGSLHGMIDNLNNNCISSAASVTNEDGITILTSKVQCRPLGCCTPAGSTKVISAYRSNVGASTDSSFCFFASTFGNALAADAVQLFVDGTVVPGGSGSAMATSGSTVVGSINLGVGGGAELGPTGPTLSGSGSLAVTASQVKADGKAAAPLTKLGSKVSASPNMVAELQSGARTQANVTRKAAADAEQLANISGLGMFGKETACGAGNFDFYRYQHSGGPLGKASALTFQKRYTLLKNQFLP